MRLRVNNSSQEASVKVCSKPVYLSKLCCSRVAGFKTGGHSPTVGNESYMRREAWIIMRWDGLLRPEREQPSNTVTWLSAWYATEPAVIPQIIWTMSNVIGSQHCTVFGYLSLTVCSPRQFCLHKSRSPASIFKDQALDRLFPAAWWSMGIGCWIGEVTGTGKGG